MSKDKSEARIKELYRVVTKDDKRKPLTIVILSDPDQFVLAVEKEVKSGKQEGSKMLSDQKYYPTIEQVLASAMHQLAKAECKDLAGYADAIRKYKDEFIAVLQNIGMSDKNPF
jgi:hypothetical protein